MHLRVERHPAVAQALDQVRLPQRPLAGEAGAVQPRAEVEQLADPAGLGQRAVPEVVLEVEVVVLGPRPLAGGGDAAGRPLEEQRRHLVDLGHLLVDPPGVVAPSTLRLLEQLEAADVHRHLPVLGEQERR